MVIFIHDVFVFVCSGGELINRYKSRYRDIEYNRKIYVDI